ncbi:CtsR family transcriptional regulator [Ignavigranum ruoffiae]|uniref:Transcriptional regulator CtsR n=1 Tax=Ignavigranum ruoffiae TaxID=89093 RepID=A0A1H9BL58_9LACT|nr:CtsR family transcriptional regulator [Ignavigranum ruoffiae]UPQ86489.1 CtsR family transcriptional regulator [Ignavigranum ruoffiae]SEP89685.1 transcriptional regulator CtsR [Ignavigranum ruoffiae]
MVKRNISDVIEAYLKSYLKSNEPLEIKRSDIAERFDCVPSQINYVINTRFTQEHGYNVESKRGGGGYIRIVKIELVDDVDEIDQMISLIGDRLNQRNSETIIETLVRRDIISKREAILLSTIVNKDLLAPISDDEQAVRAYLLKNLLNQLRIHY